MVTDTPVLHAALGALVFVVCGIAAVFIWLAKDFKN